VPTNGRPHTVRNSLTAIENGTKYCYTIWRPSADHFQPQEGIMTALLYITVVFHVIISLFLIGVVLLQQGKSADLAGAFGGQGSQTAFGPRGAANLLTKLTTYAAVFFMFTSIGLTILMTRSNSGAHSVLSGTGTTQSTPKK
jgi:preprotein translocase subunit SecG